MNDMPAAGEKIRGLTNDPTNENRSKNPIQGHSWGQGDGFYNGQRKIVFTLAQGPRQIFFIRACLFDNLQGPWTELTQEMAIPSLMGTYKG